MKTNRRKHVKPCAPGDSHNNRSATTHSAFRITMSTIQSCTRIKLWSSAYVPPAVIDLHADTDEGFRPFSINRGWHHGDGFVSSDSKIELLAHKKCALCSNFEPNLCVRYLHLRQKSNSAPMPSQEWHWWSEKGTSFLKPCKHKESWGSQLHPRYDGFDLKLKTKKVIPILS